MDDSAKGGKDYPQANGKVMDDYDADVPRFRIPVDSEHKGKSLPLWTFGFPHMRCFHLVRPPPALPAHGRPRTPPRRQGRA